LAIYSTSPHRALVYESAVTLDQSGTEVKALLRLGSRFDATDRNYGCFAFKAAD
jgi:hypothetical protein